MVRARVLEIELTSSRHVDVTTWLISAGIETERHEQRPTILRGVNVGTTEMIGGIGIEESSSHFLVKVNTVGLNAESIQNWSARLSLDLETLVSNLSRVGGISSGVSNDSTRSRSELSADESATCSHSSTYNVQGTSNLDLVTNGESNVGERNTSTSDQTTSTNTKLSTNSCGEGLTTENNLSTRFISVLSDDVVAIPVLQILTLESISGASEVIADLSTNEEIFNGPLELLQMHLG